MIKNRLKHLMGGLLAVAVLVLAVSLSPPDAMAGQGKGNKVPPGQAKKVQFAMMSDVRGHWAAEPVTVMQKQGIIKGMPDGKFHPQDKVSKCEALVMITRALGLEGQSPSDDSLEQVRNCPDWARDSVALALDKGIITSQELKNFVGNSPALRYEIAVWLGRAVGRGDLGDGNLYFVDKGKIPAYAKKFVAYMAKNKIMNGYPGGAFGPLNPVQRAEIAAMLFRCQNIFSFNPKFIAIRGTVDEVIASDPAFIILESDGDEESTLSMMIKVADDAAVFVDGSAADLEDVEAGDSVTLVLNPARVAIVVSVNSDEDTDDDDEDQNEDEDAPEVVELSPEDGADDVEAGLKTLVATFDENIYAVDSEADIESEIVVQNITEDETIDVSDVDLDGDKLYIKLAKGLQEECDYSVDVPANIIRDKEGNKFEGIDEEDWQFTTVTEDDDRDAPQIEELDPENGESVVGNINEIKVSFNENIRWVAGTSGTSKVIIIRDNNQIVPGKVSISGDQLIIEFDEALDSGGYSVMIPAGKIEDLAGNDFDGIGMGDWEFEVQ